MLEKYKSDMEKLVQRGLAIQLSMNVGLFPEYKAEIEKKLGETPKYVVVESIYQGWYSEALALITQLIPDRANDFKEYYSSNKSRKDISALNYSMSDYLRGITSRYGGKITVDPKAGMEPFRQQLAIVEGLKDRFESTLFDIKSLVQADLLDNELQAAEELNGKGFVRGAGAMAGVVLESHLALISNQHGVSVRKKNPSIADWNDALKTATVLEVSQCRFIQHLGDLRNKCDHKQQTDPTKEEVHNLIEGVRKITKTVY